MYVYVCVYKRGRHSTISSPAESVCAVAARRFRDPRRQAVPRSRTPRRTSHLSWGVPMAKPRRPPNSPRLDPAWEPLVTGFRTGQDYCLLTEGPQIPYMLPCICLMRTLCHKYHACLHKDHTYMLPHVATFPHERRWQEIATLGVNSKGFLSRSRIVGVGDKSISSSKIHKHTCPTLAPHSSVVLRESDDPVCPGPVRKLSSPRLPPRGVAEEEIR